MSITRQQANTALGRATRKMAAQYWEYNSQVTCAVVRVVVSEAKRRGDAAARNAAKAVLREIYEDIFGAGSAVGNRRFKKWVQTCCSPQNPAPLGLPEHPFNDVDLSDGFDVDAGDVIT